MGYASRDASHPDNGHKSCCQIKVTRLGPDVKNAHKILNFLSKGSSLLSMNELFCIPDEVALYSIHRPTNSIVRVTQARSEKMSYEAIEQVGPFLYDITIAGVTRRYNRVPTQEELDLMEEDYLWGAVTEKNEI